jgi:hypothetical protein
MAKNEWKSWDYREYVSEFLSLKCAGDVLNVVAPLGTKASKEITESMAVIKVLRGITLKRPMELKLLDLCAGNALTSVLAVHLLPVKEAFAMDKRMRKRRWHAVKRFVYIQSDLVDFPSFIEPSVVIAVHPCKTAVGVVDYFRKSRGAEYLVMIPCCRGGVDMNVRRFTRLELEKFGRYEQWCLYLAELCRSRGSRVKVQVYRDKKCLSPCNIMIVAQKGIRK